jgi:tetratricopeptide (TPR) repeat protein
MYRRSNFFIWFWLFIAGCLVGFGIYRFDLMLDQVTLEEEISPLGEVLKPTVSPSLISEVVVVEPGDRWVINIPEHYFQTFNNCGPATLSMVLAFFDINRTQQQIGNELRPYQNSQGDNDDKSVTLTELAQKGEELGLVAYHRPAGNIELLKKFTANNIPVITRTWTKVDEDIGHYRVVKGFDEIEGVIIQDDSLQGKDLKFSYSDFNTMWEKFSYEYLVLVRGDQVKISEAILGSDLNEESAWRRAANQAKMVLNSDQDNIYAWFNLAVALYEIGDYQGSVEAFEEVENRLPFRTLWYQIEPLLAYQKLGRHSQVLPRIEQILNNGNRAFSELYQMRGEIYLDMGDIQAARREFELALIYNENYDQAKRTLEELD